MDLPKKERTFYFKHTGRETGFVYEGTFTIKCVLNIGEKRVMELEMSRLQGDLINGTPQLKAIAEALASLRARIVDAPEWWKQGGGLSIEDEDTVVALMGEIDKNVDEFRKSLVEKAKATSGSESGN